ncbi:MAG: hypothetical protein PVH41_02510 [Anaerolineae bacterium]|jgi:hypothetical protein
MHDRRLGRLRVLRLFAGLVVLAGMVATANPAAYGQPVPPMRRHGRAYVNFEGAVDGTLVEVQSFFQSEGWVLVASDVTETVEGEPGWYGVPEHLEIDGEPGGSVRFYVSGKQALESPSGWESGTKRQDLNIRLAELAAGIDAPHGVNVDTAFEVSATITNTGLVQAEDVEAVLSLSEGAELAAGEVATKTVGIGILPAGWAREATWVVSCTAAVPVTVTVAPLGIDSTTGDPVADHLSLPETAVVEQQTPAHLVTSVLAPSQGQPVGVGYEFVVQASISNTGQADALDATATLTHTAGAELISTEVQTLGEIAGGGAGTASWTLICTDPVPVTATVMAAGVDGNSGESVVAEPAQVMVEQKPSPYLEAAIHAPGDGDGFPHRSSFIVDGSIENTGEITATNVIASLSSSGGAVISGSAGPTRTLGTLPVGASGQVSWTLQCTEIGWITVTIAPAGFHPDLGEPLPETRLSEGMVAVQQTPLIFLPTLYDRWMPAVGGLVAAPAHRERPY